MVEIGLLRGEEAEVLLINPTKNIHTGVPMKMKFGTQPMGLAYLAAYLEGSNVSVSILDAYTLALGMQDIISYIQMVKPRIVGLTGMTILVDDALFIASEIKSSFPEITVVMGGAHATAMPKEILATGVVDFVIMGEGEERLLELYCALTSNDETVSHVSSLAYMSADEFTVTPNAGFVSELDSLPFPSHHLLLPIEYYNPYPHWGKAGMYSTLISSRGCPYGCFYCSVSSLQGRKYRCRSPENVIEELKWLYRDYGVRSLSFRDGTVTLRKRRIEELCQLIVREGLSIKWNCTARVNEVDLDMLILMKKAGCVAIQYGIESGDEEQIKRLKKATLEQTRNAVELTHRAGIEAHGYFMFGVPGETETTIKETIRFSTSIPLYTAGFSIATPFPGTEFWDWVTKHKLLKVKNWSEFDVVGSTVFSHPELDESTILRSQKVAYRKFYIRPTVLARLIWDNLRSLSSLRGLFFKFVEKFLTN